MMETSLLAAPSHTGIILHSIDKRIAGNTSRFSGIDIRSGIAGLSLYNYAAADYFNSPLHLQRAEKSLEKCFHKLNNGYLSATLYREMAELGWLLEICKAAKKYDADTNEVLNDVDAILLPQMQEELAQKNFDPATGALAYGFYFLSRLPSNPGLKETVRRLAQSLMDLSWKDEKGVYWKSKLKEGDPIYLGISHGSAAIIIFLIRCVEACIEIDCRELVRQAAAYIRASETLQSPCFFPVIVGEGIRHNIFANNWCYGDPGTLYGLLEAALFLHDAELKQYVLNRFSSVVTRQNDTTYLIAGYGLLYGNAGLAMLYNKCHELTGESFFREAYEEQIGLIVANFNPCDKYLGFAGYWNQEFPVTNYTFSEGLIGIALVLMAYEDNDYSKYFRPLYYL